MSLEIEKLGMISSPWNIITIFHISSYNPLGLYYIVFCYLLSLVCSNFPPTGYGPLSRSPCHSLCEVQMIHTHLYSLNWNGWILLIKRPPHLHCWHPAPAPIQPKPVTHPQNHQLELPDKCSCPTNLSVPWCEYQGSPQGRGMVGLEAHTLLELTQQVPLILYILVEGSPIAGKTKVSTSTQEVWRIVACLPMFLSI